MIGSKYKLILITISLVLIIHNVYSQGPIRKRIIKNQLVKAFLGTHAMFHFTKPKKGMLPIPIPIPIPMPIEWENAPVVVHPVKKSVPIPEPQASMSIPVIR